MLCLPIPRLPSLRVLHPCLPAALAAVLMTVASGCASPPARTSAPSTAREAIANMAPASGSLVSGRLTLVPMQDGVHIQGDIGGLAPDSSHGFHIHEKGDCSAVDAASAGGHFNPSGVAHGRSGHGAHHAGDAENIVADTRGVAHVNVHVPGVRLGGGSAAAIEGRALIVHAQPDDYSSQPSGNAGARVACGVIRITP